MANEPIDPRIQDLMDDATGDLAVGALDGAVDKFRQCTVIAPESFDAWHSLGMALMKAGKIDDAIEAGLVAVRLRPNDQLAWSSLSLFYVRANRVQDAESAGVKARILGWGAKLRVEDSPDVGGPSASEAPGD